MKRKPSPRPTRPCDACGIVGRRVGSLCSRCMGKTPNTLTDGAWVLDPVRRIRVWRESEAS